MEIIRREAQNTWCDKCEKTQPHVLTESLPLAYFLFSCFKREMMKKITKECNICGEKDTELRSEKAARNSTREGKFFSRFEYTGTTSMSIVFVKDTCGKEMVLKNCKKCGGLQLFETQEITLFGILKKGGNDCFSDDRKDTKDRDYAALVLKCTRCGEEGGYII